MATTTDAPETATSSTGPSSTGTNSTGTSSTGTNSTETSSIETITSRERADLLQTLATHRHFLRITAKDLTDDQARMRTTPSELSIGGLINHVAATESAWYRFAVGGAAGMASAYADNPDAPAAEWPSEFELRTDQTLSEALEHYADVARRTDQLVSTVPDLDLAHPLPEAPWFEPGATWSIRRVLLHVIAETAQHAGHADIIREALDGSKTMG